MKVTSAPRTRVVIQSRLNSSRLPGKALLPVGGYPLIELVARRASRSGHDVVVATSDEDYDEVITHHLTSVGLPTMRGPLDDVLGRFVDACADLGDDDRVIRLTGDNPLVDDTLVDELIEATGASGHSYGRVDVDAVPEGLGAEVFSVKDLRTAARHATSPYDREHVTPWLRRELGEYLCVPQGSPEDIHAYRATVDTLNDYVRVARLFRMVDDPVQAPWQELMSRLGEGVRAAGPRAVRKEDGLDSPAAVILGASPDAEVDSHPGATRGQTSGTARELLAFAVDQGVTDVIVDAESATEREWVRGATLPALAGRLRYLLRLGSSTTDASTTAHVRAEVEQAFSYLGQRRARCLLAAHPYASAPAWEAVHDYLSRGIVEAAGCVVSSRAELEQAMSMPWLSVIEVADPLADWYDGSSQLCEEAARSETKILLRLSGPAASSKIERHLSEPWVSAIVVTPATSLQLAEMFTAASGQPA